MEWIVIGFKIGIGLALAILAIVVIVMITGAIIGIIEGIRQSKYKDTWGCIGIIVLFIGVMVLFRLIGCWE